MVFQPTGLALLISRPSRGATAGVNAICSVTRQLSSSGARISATKCAIEPSPSAARFGVIAPSGSLKQTRISDPPRASATPNELNADRGVTAPTHTAIAPASRSSITYLLPLLIGYTGGRMMYDDNIRGGVVGAIATMGAITGAERADVPRRDDHGPARRLVDEEARRAVGRQDPARLRDAGRQLLRRHPRAAVLAIFGFFGRRPDRRRRSPSWPRQRRRTTLVDHHLLPLTSVFIEPAKVLFLNNAINHGVLTPLGTTQAAAARQVGPVPAGGQPRSRARPAAGLHRLRQGHRQGHRPPVRRSSSSSAASTRSTSPTC